MSSGASCGFAAGEVFAEGMMRLGSVRRGRSWLRLRKGGMAASLCSLSFGGRVEGNDLSRSATVGDGLVAGWLAADVGQHAGESESEDERSRAYIDLFAMACSSYSSA